MFKLLFERLPTTYHPVLDPDEIFARGMILNSYAKGGLFDMEETNSHGGKGYKFHPKTERAKGLLRNPIEVWDNSDDKMLLDVIQNKEIDVVWDTVPDKAEKRRGDYINRGNDKTNSIVFPADFYDKARTHSGTTTSELLGPPTPASDTTAASTPTMPQRPRTPINYTSQEGRQLAEEIIARANAHAIRWSDSVKESVKIPMLERENERLRETEKTLNEIVARLEQENGGLRDLLNKAFAVLRDYPGAEDNEDADGH